MAGISVPNTALIYFTLFIICIVSTDNYFAYHAPSATAEEYETSYLLNTQQFGTLFTIYSAPNIVLVFFSGMFVDKFGVRLSSLFFNTLIVVGMVLCALTPFPSSSFPATVSYILLLLGRLLLGLGGESICACTSTMISKWFTKSGMLNTAMAINQGAVQLFGSSAAFYLLPRVKSLYWAQWITVVVCVTSLASNLIYNAIEGYYTEYLEELNKEETGPSTMEFMALAASNAETSNLCAAVKISSTYQSINQNDTTGESSSGLEGSSLWSGIKDVLGSFSFLFWLVLIHIGLMSPILYTFTAFGPLYLMENFDSTQSLEQAGDAISLLYMAIVAAPIAGMIIDRVGHRSLIQFIASANIPVIFLLLTYKVLPPSPCLLWMGLMYSITEANGLALISLIVPPESQGTAFGLCGCFISLALLVEPAAVGTLREWSGAFTSSIWVFTSMTVLGALLAGYVMVFDQAHDSLISGRPSVTKIASDFPPAQPNGGEHSICGSTCRTAVTAAAGVMETPFTVYGPFNLA